MRNYYIAPETHEREKIIGGKIDAVQIAWISAFVILGAIVSIGFYFAISFFSLAFGLPIIGIGLLFAFYKHKESELTLFQVLKRNYYFNKKSKYLHNKVN